MDSYAVAIIGAGPAGLFCAIHAAAPGSSVLVLEKKASPGTKLRITGSGQCNLTHAGDMTAFLSHFGGHGAFLKPALRAFTNQALIQFFTERGCEMETEPMGKVFPVSRRASDILDILLRECHERHVTVQCGETVETVTWDPAGYRICTNHREYLAARLVITTGGASYPVTGSTGDGYRFAARLGHTIVPTGPALTPVIIANHPFADLAGVSFKDMRFSVWRDGRKVLDARGDVLVTHEGLSGPGILDCSRALRQGDTIRCSFVSGTMTTEEFGRDLTGRIQTNGKKMVRSVLSAYDIPERLEWVLLRIAGVPEDLTCAHLSAPLRSRLIAAVTDLPLTIAAPGNFSVAMVTRGGVALPEVNSKTMESRCVPGLFFAGEVLDIDGDTGGYNLQAAFSTGRCAGVAIRSQLDGVHG
ncbi:MAG: NAD(P)/FAD-dependent oxidoreductase [Methanoregula sp.]